LVSGPAQDAYVARSSAPAAVMVRGHTLSTSSDWCEVTAADGQQLAAITRHDWGRLGWFSDRTKTVRIGEIDGPLRILVGARAVTAFTSLLEPRNGGDGV
jgi:hypothetical protein